MKHIKLVDNYKLLGFKGLDLHRARPIKKETC